MHRKKTIIIAEAGECYNGSMDVAHSLIGVAKEAGCDYIKFQTLDYENISDDDPEKEWFLKIALNPKRIRQLIQWCREEGIKILFTPENIKTAKWLLEEKLDTVKIASSCLCDGSLVNFVNNNFKTVFLSTGMASLEEIRRAVGMLTDIRDLYIIHCISEYPTGPLLEERGLRALRPEDAHINMMLILKDEFSKYHVGYSDHTNGIIVPLVAAAAGAEVIEKHITMDRSTPIRNYNEGKEYLGTDHVLSVEPAELKEMVKEIRKAGIILGEKKWKRTKGEEMLKAFLRKRFSKI